MIPTTGKRTPPVEKRGDGVAADAANSASVPAKPAAGRGRPSQAATDSRRREVIAAARREFLASGYRSATMARIAAQAGVSKRTLYLWHQDKAALFQTCVVEGTRDLQLPSLDSSLDIPAALMTYGAVLLPAVSNAFSIDMTRLMFREGPDFAEVREALSDGSRMITAPVATFLMAKGYAATEAQSLADIFVVGATALVQRIVVQGGEPPDLAENIAHLTTVVRLFTTGLSTPAGPDER